MAEGGDVTKTVDGSDYFFQFTCSPCADAGYNNEGINFCQVCDEFLCHKCTHHHQHQRLLKQHKLVPAASAKKTSGKAKTKDVLAVIKCQFHSDRDVEMYCGNHDMVYCALCIAKDHRSCTDVEEIDDTIHKPNTSRLQKIISDLGSINKQLLDLKQDKSTDLKLLQKQRAELLKEINDLRKEMNAHFDQIERDIKQELDTVISKLEQDIRDEISTADDMVTTINETKTDIGNINSKKQKFIAEKVGQKVMSDANSFIVKAKTSGRRSIKFERNCRLYKSVKVAENMGQLIVDAVDDRVTGGTISPVIGGVSKQGTQQRKFTIKSSSASSVKVNTDAVDCRIVDMCQLEDGTIIIADYKNRKLKRLNSQLTVNDYCDLESQPDGLCPISSTEVAVRYEDAVQFVHVGRTLSPGRTIKLAKGNTAIYNKVAFCNGMLWTLGRRCVYIYSAAGDLVKEVNTYPHGQKFASDDDYQPRGIAVSNDDSKVYVTAREDMVIVLNNNGEILTEVREQRLQLAYSVCVTDNGVVMVSGLNSKNVVIYSGDETMRCLGELSLPTNMLSNPYSMCYDKANSRLLFGFVAGNVIQIFQLSE